MKKIIMVIIISLLAAYFTSSAAPQMTLAAGSPVFKDVKGHWAEKTIYDAVKKGYVSGFPDGTFKPTAPVTAGQLMTMVLLSLSEDQGDGTRWWSDSFYNRIGLGTKMILDTGSPGFIFKGGNPFYKPFVDQMINMNIIPKRNQWYKNYNAYLTREDVAYIIHHTMSLIEDNLDQRYKKLSILKIKDYNLIDEEDQNSVLEAYMKGVINGYPNGKFGAGKVVSRAEAVTMIEKMNHLELRKPYKPDISIHPHAFVPMGYDRLGKKQPDSIVIFPDRTMNLGYKTLQESEGLTSGILEQTALNFRFYYNQVALDKEHENAGSIYTFFNRPTFDLSMAVSPDSNLYGISISVRTNALEKHEKALQNYLNFLFESEAKEARSAIDSYLKKLRSGELKKDETITLNNRQIHFMFPDPDRDFLQIGISVNTK